MKTYVYICRSGGSCIQLEYASTLLIAWNTNLLQGGLADTVVNDAQSLLVALQLAEYRGPGQASTRQLIGH